MASNAHIERINWALIGVTVAGLVFATFVAISIGSGGYLTLACLAAFLAFVAYITYFRKYTWQVALLLCYMGLFFWPLGFRIGPTELTSALAVLLAVTTAWQKRSVERVGVLKHGSFSLLRGLLLLWVVYAAFHMWYNIRNPLLPSEFTLKNALKTYFEAIMPIALLWYFSGNPKEIRLKANFMRTLAILLLVGVIFNIAITCYGIVTHHNVVDPDVQYSPAFLIPGINAFENPFMLRVLGPAAVLFSATILCLGSRLTRVSWTVSVPLLLVGFLGCLLSSGRAAVVTAVLLVLAMLLLRKQIGALFTLSVLSVSFVLFINVFSDWINHSVPVAIARPLQWMMVSKNKEAEASIESSSRWREELFKMSIAEWRSNPRIFWFGRATYGYGVNDYVAQQLLGGFEAGKESSLRRGVTHNLFTDLLVMYGLIGCILYYSLVLAIIWFLWIAYRSPTVPSPLKPLGLICLITFVSYPMTATIAGGLYTPENMWLLVVFVAALYQYESRSNEPKETSALLPEPVPRRLAQLAK